MRYDLAGGWHLQRVEVGNGFEWIICDPDGDALGNTEKHKAEFDAAMRAKPNMSERKPGGNYVKADRCIAGEPPFLFSIDFQFIPAGPSYPECFCVRDKDGKVVAWLTDTQVREALKRFDEMA